MNNTNSKPSNAFIAASWVSLFTGFLAYNIGLWNANMQLNEKGYYFTLLLYGLFSAVSLQKSVRDKLDGIAVTGIYFGLCWASVLISILLLGIGLACRNLRVTGYFNDQSFLQILHSI